MGIKRTVKRATAPAIVTVGEAFDRFENEKRALGIVEKTIGNYKQSLDYFMDFYSFDYAKTDVNSLTRDLFLNWTADMAQQGKTHSTINHYLRDCRAFLYWCMNDNNKLIQPSFKIDMVKGQAPAQKTFSEADMAVLLAKPKNDNDFAEWRTWVMVNLIFDMGARAGSIVEIQIGDINFQKRTIYLRHTKNKALNHKTISSHCAKILKEYIAEWRSTAAMDDYLFCNSAGDQLTYNALAHSFSRYCNERGVDKSSIHGLRHTFATALAESTNGDMVKVQKALGHSSIDMARKYVDLAAVDMGDYNSISPLAKTKSGGRGRPAKGVKKATN